MSSRNRIRFATVSSVMLASAILLATPVRSEQGCVAFHAVIQAELFPEQPVREGDVWGGSVYAYLGQQILIGRYSGNNGDTSSHGVSNSGIGSDAWDFGNGNTFTSLARHASFPTPPGFVAGGLGGFYQAPSDNFVAGTGIFQNASGSYTNSGPWLVWFSDDGIHGRWNGEVDGKICGVE